MVYIVMPAKDEAQNIKIALDNCVSCNYEKIIVIANGCRDNTEEVVRSHSLFNENKIILLSFPEPLGIDIPRALGAAYAYKNNCQGVVFLDGDIIGNVAQNISDLIHSIINKNADLALTNCYPYINYREPLVQSILKFREKLNRKINLFTQLGVAIPSHGPHGLSRKALEIIPWPFIAIPPLSLAFAAQVGLKVKVVTSIPHYKLLSAPRGIYHTIKIGETIIGDCLEGISYVTDGSRQRTYQEHNYLGYHLSRRFDLLEGYIASLSR